MTTIRLSNLQFPMLQAFINQDKHYMSIEEAKAFDQRPFRSMLIQGWVAYVPERGFHITPKGRRAWQDYHSRDIARKNSSLPLTAYFDPNSYKLARRDGIAIVPPKRKRAAKAA